VTGFQYRDADLICDGVPLEAIAREHGTPVYVYSAAVVRARYRELNAAFAGYAHAVHYALKANSTLAIVRLLRDLGSRVDANSGGEIELALKAGFSPGDIVFTGVGKTDAELDRAVSLGLQAINAESAGEVERIARLAAARGLRVPVAIRINPDIDPGSHPHISTGLGTNKFGIPIPEAAAVCRQAAAEPGLRLTGLHVHIGSQIRSLAPVRRAAAALARLAGTLREEGVQLEHLDIGGGLGVSYEGAPAPSAAEYADAVLAEIRGTGLPLLIEPGRTIVAPAGVLLATVVDVKQHGGRRFVVLDTGMTELLRPALYGAYHRILPVQRGSAAASGPCDIVGPICESSDTFGVDRDLPPVAPGNILSIMDAGAYGSVMASNYNRRPLPAEVLVDEGRARLIRRRQTYEDMLALEI
jgi:diaminopimelate decarboxylase